MIRRLTNSFGRLGYLLRNYRKIEPMLGYYTYFRDDDADHEYEGVRADIAWAKARGVKIISGHDYTAGKPGVMRAVNEAFGADIRLHGSIWAHVERGITV